MSIVSSTAQLSGSVSRPDLPRAPTVEAVVAVQKQRFCRGLSVVLHRARAQPNLDVLQFLSVQSVAQSRDQHHRCS